jgi:hypothetical protein
VERAKKQAMIAVPSIDGRVTCGLAHALAQAAALSKDPDFPWEFELFMQEGVTPVDNARNRCVEAFLSTGADRLFFIDADMKPPHAWWALLGHDEDAVSGFALGWGSAPKDPRSSGRPGVLTVAYSEKMPEEYFSLPIDSWQPFRADAVGAACLVLKRWIFEKMPRPWFETLFDPKTRKLARGEDIEFFRKAGQLGVKPLIDPRIAFGHMKTVDLLDVADFRFVESSGVFASPRKEGAA